MDIKYVENGFSFNPKIIIVFLISLLVVLIGGMYLPFISVVAGFWIIDIFAIFAYAGLIIGAINLSTKLLKVPSNKTIRILYAIIGIFAVYFYILNYTFQFELYAYGSDLFNFVFLGYGDGPLYYPQLILMQAVNLPLAIEGISYCINLLLKYAGADGVIMVLLFAAIAIVVPLATIFGPSAAFKPFDVEKNTWYKRVFHKSYAPTMKSNKKVLEQALKDGDFSYFEESDIESISSNRVDVYLFQNEDGEYTDIIEVMAVVRDNRNRTTNTSLIKPIHITDKYRRQYFTNKPIIQTQKEEIILE